MLGINIDRDVDTFISNQPAYIAKLAMIRNTEKTRSTRRYTASKAKYRHRKNAWQIQLPTYDRDYIRFKDYRLKTSGNPYNSKAVYRGTTHAYEDRACCWKGPYHHTKSDWQARLIDRDIRNYRSCEDEIIYVDEIGGDSELSGCVLNESACDIRLSLPLFTII